MESVPATRWVSASRPGRTAGGAARRQHRPGGRSAEGGVGALRRGVMVVLDLVLVADDLAIKLVHQLVDRGVEVFRGALGEKILALDVDGHLGLLPALLLG